MDPVQASNEANKLVTYEPLYMASQWIALFRVGNDFIANASITVSSTREWRPRHRALEGDGRVWERSCWRYQPRCLQRSRPPRQRVRDWLDAPRGAYHEYRLSRQHSLASGRSLC